MEVQVSPGLYNGGYHISCHGGNNGKINTLVIGGTPPITYSWSNGATTQLIEQLVTGTYTVTVTQSGGSTATASIVLHEPSVLDPSLYSALYPGGTNISLYGGQDGSIQVTDQGGTPPYVYLWSNSSQEQNQYELNAATYTVTVTDANACTTTGSITLTQPAPLTISSITSPTYNGYHVPCFGGYGSIDLTLTGGAPPYEILWNNGSFDEDPAELTAGDYSVRVTDQNNNQVEASITLTEPDALSLQLAPFVFANNYHISLFGGYDGSINTNTGGGVTPYTFLWNDGSTLQNHTTLNHGLKAITLTDANGCTVAAEILLLEPASADWMMNGNANTNPLTQYIGTSDSTDAVFKTNDIERLRINAAGEIKITSLADTNAYNLVYTDSTGALKTGNPPPGPKVSVPWMTLGNNAIVPGNFIGPTNGEDFIMKTAPEIGMQHVERMRITKDGNVGIGTATPIAKLDVSVTAGPVEINCYTPSQNFSKIWTKSSGYGYAFGMEASGVGHIYYGLGVNSQPAIAFNQYGKVGIGMDPLPNNNNNLNYKLYVDGSIAARELKVTTLTFPDYVFDLDYPLISINELEKFIFINHHLPEIPSAAEIARNEGFEVGAMQTLLLKKIEEQSLYIINLQKQIDQLNANMHTLILK